MEAVDSKLEFLEYCLKKYQYPLIFGKSKEEIAYIFDSSNRSYLVSWLLKKIDGGFCDLLESDSNPSLLDEIVYAQGFTTSKEKGKFINCALPMESQLQILHKMFKFMDDVCSVRAENASVQKLEMEEVTQLQHSPLNLFASQGPLQVLNPKQRIAKLIEYREEYAELTRKSIREKAPISSGVGDGNIDLTELQANKVAEELHSAFSSFKELLPQFKEKVYEIMKKQESQKYSQVAFNSNSENVVKEACQNMELISEFIRNMEVIANFDEKEAFRLIEWQHNKELLNMLESVAHDLNGLNVMQKNRRRGRHLL